MKLFSRLEKSRSFWFLLIISVVFFLLRWPSLFEPYWYGDEGIYQAVGMLLNSGQSLYSGAWDNKPPLLYVLYAIFSSDQFSLRVLSLFFGLFSVWAFYFTVKRLLPKSKYGAIASTSLYTFAFGTRLIEGNIANAENFMLFPILVSAYIIISGDYIKKAWHSRFHLLAGFFMSLAFLTKIVAIFDFMALLFFILIDHEKDLKDKFGNRALPLILGFGLPTVLILGYFFLTNNFKDAISGFLFSNVGYVGYGNEFIIPQGLLYIKAALLATFLGFVFWKRKKIPRNVLFASVWFAFSLFSAFFAQRPYTHYLIMLLPSFCLMVGTIIEEKKTRVLLAIFLVVGYLAIINTFNLKGKIIQHYTNLIAFCSDKKDVASYQAFFDSNTPRDYDLARYIKANTTKDDSIFIWGNNAQVYKLSEKTPIMRYTVAYHITNYPTGLSEMENAIRTKEPKLIVIMPNVPEFPMKLINYEEKIDIRGVKIYEKVF